MEEWKSSRSYEDLLRLNIRYIEGKINWAPYHKKPINHGPLKDDLIKVNELGFLTLGGQCAMDTSVEEKKLFLEKIFCLR